MHPGCLVNSTYTKCRCVQSRETDTYAINRYLLKTKNWESQSRIPRVVSFRFVFFEYSRMKNRFHRKTQKYELCALFTCLLIAYATCSFSGGFESNFFFFFSLLYLLLFYNVARWTLAFRCYNYYHWLNLALGITMGTIFYSLVCIFMNFP